MTAREGVVHDDQSAGLAADCSWEGAIEIDGIARRLVLCPPDLDPVHLPHVVGTADVDVVITDRPLDAAAGIRVECVVITPPWFDTMQVAASFT